MQASAYTIPVKDRVCRAFTYSAIETWSDLGDDPTLGEDSITDYRILTLRRQCPDEVRIQKFNRRQEGKNGADWEWWFGGAAGWFGMRVQAKKLELGSMEYEHLDHRVKGSGRLQVDLLIEDATSRDLFAMYLFYNNWSGKTVAPWRCRSFREDERLWGHSIASAHVVEQLVAAGTKAASSVAESAFPVTCLACCRGFTGGGDPSLPERARSVAEVLAARSGVDVPSLVPSLPPHAAQVKQGDGVSPRSVPSLDGILVIEERTGAYDS